MRAWVDQVPAIVHAWYPGQNGGQALAEILVGLVNPSGKLPATFEQRWEDNPSYPYYHAPSGGSTRYEEGLFVGYRGFDRLGRDPLFPFGYGLSYTTFEYSDLSLAPERVKAGEAVTLSFSIKNTGTRAGAEVAQLYVEPIRPPVERPIRELKRFQKVSLHPGETKRITLELDNAALAYYDDVKREWVAAPGDYRILVGASSRDLPLRGRFTFGRPGTQRRPRESAIQ
jgi:beta-glucosidase